MRQFTYGITKPEDLQQALQTFAKECPISYTSILACVFTATLDREKIMAMTREIKAAVPQALIAGSSTSGEIIDGQMRESSTILTFLVFREAHVSFETYDCDAMSVQQAGKACLEACKQMEHVAGICLIGTLKSFNAKPFLVEISKIKPAVPIFGGGAGTYEKKINTCVFTEQHVWKNGMVVVVFAGEGLHIHLGTNFGWRPMGRAMTITAMDGPMVIKELDFKPAVSVYEKYLNITVGDNFLMDIMEFPLFVKRNGAFLARLPSFVKDDGSLVFAADFKLGEKVCLAYGDPNEILVSSRSCQREIARFQPEGLLIFSCLTRKAFLGMHVNIELEPYRQVAPTAGFFTYGEIASFQDEAEALNIMFLAVGFREGDPTGQPVLSEDTQVDQEFRGNMSLLQRLCQFINVTTAELEEANRNQELANHKLEEANRRLLKLARQDRLTELYNRGEISDILEREICRLRDEDLPMSAIMIDLDDFKLINDTYGHGKGDEVLRIVAKTLLRGIRGGDYAGRWGGEEFIILLPGSLLQTAKMVAERIREKIEQLALLPDNASVTGSFGVCQIRTEESVDEFYRRIDAALYLAKRKGKNRVEAGEE